MEGKKGQPINVYVHRQAATPKACYVCHKQTPHVLVSQSIPTIDFIYVCVTHLGDRHFATKVADAPSTQAEKVSASEIEKVKAEWQAKQTAKEKRDKEQQEAKDNETKAKSSVASSVFSTITSTVSSLAFPAKPTGESTTTTTPPPSAAPPVNPYPLHAKYALHREFYAARTREHNNRNFKKRERELNMPPVPKNTLS